MLTAEIIRKVRPNADRKWDWSNKETSKVPREIQQFIANLYREYTARFVIETVNKKFPDLEVELSEQMVGHYAKKYGIEKEEYHDGKRDFRRFEREY